jgi:hypothetical protein
MDCQETQSKCHLKCFPEGATYNINNLHCCCCGGNNDTAKQNYGAREICYGGCEQ